MLYLSKGRKSQDPLEKTRKSYDSLRKKKNLGSSEEMGRVAVTLLPTNHLQENEKLFKVEIVLYVIGVDVNSYGQ